MCVHGTEMLLWVKQVGHHQPIDSSLAAYKFAMFEYGYKLPPCSLVRRDSIELTPVSIKFVVYYI